MMIGMPDSARICLHTSRPEIPGSIRSSSTRSGWTSRNTSSARDPSRTTAGSNPSPRNTMVSISARAGSSSTTSTRALMPTMVSSRAGGRWFIGPTGIPRRCPAGGLGRAVEHPIDPGRTGSGQDPLAAWDDESVSMPHYPRPEQYGAGRRVENPGLIPLRPLGVGDVLAAAVLVVRRHLLPLGAVAVLVSAASTAVTLGVIAAGGSLSTYADSSWFEDLLAGTSTSIPGSILVAAGLGTLVSAIGAPVVAGMASAYAGAEALGREGSGAVTERLAGRWPVLLGLAAAVGVLVSIGLAVFLVPGVLAYLVLALAAPVAVMERSGVQASMRRSAQLTHGHRGRILGAVALAMIIGFFVDVLASILASAIFGSVDAVTAAIRTPTLREMTSAVTASTAPRIRPRWPCVSCADRRIDACTPDRSITATGAASASTRYAITPGTRNTARPIETSTPTPAARPSNTGQRPASRSVTAPDPSRPKASAPAYALAMPATTGAPMADTRVPRPAATRIDPGMDVLVPASRSSNQLLSA